MPPVKGAHRDEPPLCRAIWTAIILAMSENLKLSLNGGGGQSGAGSNPVAGWFAVGFGLLGIFASGPVFVPLAFITSLIALFLGQFIWAVLGLMLAVAGFLTSPLLWGLLGLGALIAWLNSLGIPLPPGVTI